MDTENILPVLHEYVRRLMQRSTAEQPAWNLELQRSGQPNKWNYIDGCMIRAILALYEISQEKACLDFAQAFVDSFVMEDGRIRTYKIEEFNLDNVCPARNLITLYQYTGEEKYKLAMQQVRQQLTRMPRTRAGSFWHKKIYPWQVWLDGLYMAQPFYMAYETQFNHMKGCRDSFLQFLNVEKFMKKPNGLYFHGYDESRQMYWADPRTGCSPHCWLRALGWLAAALVDTLEVMDEQMYYEKRHLERMLQELAAAVLLWQQPNGMFYQVIDYPLAPGNYWESSGTALMAYAFLKGKRLGFLSSGIAEAGRLAFSGLTQTCLKQDETGDLSLGGICLVAGLGGPRHRDGSLQYYFSEPVVENEAKGIAPLLLAYTELCRPPAAADDLPCRPFLGREQPLA